MKMLNKKLVRTLSCAAVAVCAAAMLSVGAFAAEVDSTCVEGYLQRPCCRRLSAPAGADGAGRHRTAQR